MQDAIKDNISDIELINDYDNMCPVCTIAPNNTKSGCNRHHESCSKCAEIQFIKDGLCPSCREPMHNYERQYNVPNYTCRARCAVASEKFLISMFTLVSFAVMVGIVPLVGYIINHARYTHTIDTFREAWLIGLASGGWVYLLGILGMAIFLYTKFMFDDCRDSIDYKKMEYEINYVERQ